MKNNGSEVSGTINNDHALAGLKFLMDNGYDSAWQVVTADDKMLMLDYDDHEYDGGLPEQFYRTLGVLEEVQGAAVYFKASVSKGGNAHVVIHLNIPLPIVERIAWQAAFGSDPMREALHLLSVSRNELNPILLFMRKDAPNTGVDEHGSPVWQASSYDIATPQKLLAAGVPPLLLGDGNVS